MSLYNYDKGTLPVGSSRPSSSKTVKNKNKPFEIGGQSIAPGQSGVINLELPSLYTMQAPLNMAVHVINGKEAGPTLLVSAAIHGDELNGVDIVRRLFKRKGLKRLKGTLVAIPIVNVFGIMQHSRYLPDGRDLNRSFPGSEQGSLTARLANAFTEQILSKCTHGIDLHTGGRNRTNLPQIRADLDDPTTLELALAFGVPAVVNSRLRDGSLRKTAGEMNIPFLLYEAGESLRFDAFSIRSGVNGIISVMRYLKMLPQSRGKKPNSPYVASSSSWVRAPTSGIFLNHQALGASVKQGEILGVISDPSNMFEDPQVAFEAPFDGIVIGHTQLPLVNEGDAVMHIASFESPQEVEAELQSFEDDVMDQE